jgi:hypothetical protein
MKRSIFTAVFVLAGLSSYAQNEVMLTGKKWVVHHVEKATTGENSKRAASPSPQAGDGIIFNADGTYVSVDQGRQTKGTWDLSEGGTRLVFRTEDVSQTNDFRIVSINEQEALIVTKVKGDDLHARLRVVADQAE